MRQGFLFGLSALAMCLSPMNGALADAFTIGTQGLADLGTTTANGSPTGNINTATTFMIANLVSTSANTGVFAGLPTQTFGAVPFTVGSPVLPTIAFTSAAFGTFTYSSITEPINNTGFVNLVADGLWSPGTFAEGMGVTGGPFEAELRLSFTQTPAGNGSISASGTLSVVPEPSSIVTGITGLAGVVICGLRRRRRTTSAVA